MLVVVEASKLEKLGGAQSISSSWGKSINVVLALYDLWLKRHCSLSEYTIHWLDTILIKFIDETYDYDK